MQITFTAATNAELMQQLREFIGTVALPAQAAPPAQAPSSGLPVPDWAPPGSRWLKLPGAPTLVGPDSATIPVVWSGTTPTPGVLVHRRDEASEAAGEALRHANGGIG